jgi:hypothetical protein
VVGQVMPDQRLRALWQPGLQHSFNCSRDHAQSADLLTCRAAPAGVTRKLGAV